MSSSEFTKQASQFIGCIDEFVCEMRRLDSLNRVFPPSATATNGLNLAGTTYHWRIQDALTEGGGEILSA